MLITKEKIIPKCPNCLTKTQGESSCSKCNLNFQESANYQIPSDLLWYSKEIDKAMSAVFNTKKMEEK